MSVFYPVESREYYFSGTDYKHWLDYRDDDVWIEALQVARLLADKNLTEAPSSFMFRSCRDIEIHAKYDVMLTSKH